MEILGPSQKSVRA